MANWRVPEQDLIAQPQRPQTAWRVPEDDLIADDPVSRQGVQPAAEQPAPAGLLNAEKPYEGLLSFIPGGWGKETSNVLKGVGQGMTWGFGDELWAGGGELLERAGILDERPYEERRQEYIRPYEAEQRRSPASRGILTVAEILGGLGTGGAIPKLLHKVAPTVATPILTGPTAQGPVTNFLGQTATMAGHGAAHGAAYGAGTADPGERAEGASTGAAYGAGLGAAMPVAGPLRAVC